MTQKHFHVLSIVIAWTVAIAGSQAAQGQGEGAAGKSEGHVYRVSDSYDDFAAQNGYGSAFVGRFGWWGVSRQGNLAGVGEWDSLKPAPFWDFDGLRSDGNRTLDLSLNGTEQEANSANVYLYRAGTTVTLDYERFLHRLPNNQADNVNLIFDPLQPPGRYREAARWTPNPDGTFTRTSRGALTRQIIGQDLNVGDDAAIRVQELKASIRGDLTSNIKYRVNVWGMKKEGERQVFGTGHCFNGVSAAPGHPTNPPVASGSLACHNLSSTQRIDWTTMQIEPMLIADYGPLTITYSHKIRALDQNDEVLLRNYTTNTPARTIGSTSGSTPNYWDYALVPESVHNIDRLRLGWDVTENTKAYANLFIGNTHDSYRETDRQYSGWDVRLSNQSLEDVEISGYIEQYAEYNDEIPAPRAVPSQVTSANSVSVATLTAGTGSDEIAPASPLYRTTDWRVPRWNYDRRSIGTDARWRPFGGGGDLEGVSITGGYDHTDFLRGNAVVPTEEFDLAPFAGEEVEIGSTAYDTLSAGISRRFSPSLDAFARYKRVWIRNPLFAVHWPNERENSNLPTDVDLVEFGGTWFPSDSFMTTATIGIENRSNNTAIADFEEESYPISFSAWYAATQKLSFNGGLGFYSNSIGQDMIFGDMTGGYRGPPNPARFNLFPVVERVSYSGRSTVVNVGLTYACTERIRLLGGVDWVRGENGFEQLPLWPEMNALSRVIVTTTRLTAGVDWQLRSRITAYCRYIYYNWDDGADSSGSGTAHAVLGGLSAIF